jgi:Uma2 family endonuclease
MTQAAKKLSFEEYLNYDDGTDIRYEFVDGELAPLPTESTLSTQIAIFLIAIFLQLGIPIRRLGIKHQISVKSRIVTAREPDLVVHSDASIEAIDGLPQALLEPDMPNPLLVVEIVSPGDANHKRDYEVKRKEYQNRGIPEYWLIDPEQATITVLHLVDAQYVEFGTFKNRDRLLSPTFQEINLTCDQVFAAGT